MAQQGIFIYYLSKDRFWYTFFHTQIQESLEIFYGNIHLKEGGMLQVEPIILVFKICIHIPKTCLRCSIEQIRKQEKQMCLFQGIMCQQESGDGRCFVSLPSVFKRYILKFRHRLILPFHTYCRNRSRGVEESKSIYHLRSLCSSHLSGLSVAFYKN